MCVVCHEMGRYEWGDMVRAMIWGMRDEGTVDGVEGLVVLWFCGRGMLLSLCLLSSIFSLSLPSLLSTLSSSSIFSPPAVSYTSRFVTF